MDDLEVDAYRYSAGDQRGARAMALISAMYPQSSPVAMNPLLGCIVQVAVTITAMSPAVAS